MYKLPRRGRYQILKSFLGMYKDINCNKVSSIGMSKIFPKAWETRGRKGCINRSNQIKILWKDRFCGGCLNITWYDRGQIQISLFICIVPAFWDSVLRHCLDPDYSSWKVSLHCIFVVMWRLAPERGSLLECVSLCAFVPILVFSIVADRMQVAQVAFIVAHPHSFYLL